MKGSTKFLGILFVCVLIMSLLVTSAFASSHTVVVTPASMGDWTLNPDAPNVTPAGFSTAQASIGIGSIHAAPIGNPPAAKLILKYEPAASIPVSSFESVSIDFRIDAASTSTAPNPHKQFYINVYTLAPGATSWYSCRFDYVAGSGSTTNWTQLTAASSATPTSVGKHSSVPTCPTTLAGMPSGSVVWRIAVNLGDTSANDVGIGGFFDKAQLTVGGSTTVFDFEPYVVASSKDACKNGGYAGLARTDGSTFKNQGDCIQFVNTGK